MSLTFRNVPKSSRRLGRSQSRSKKRHKNKHFHCPKHFHENEYFDDFPPLKSAAEDLAMAPNKSALDWEFFDESFDDESFEEARWKEYRGNDFNAGKHYSQCLIKSKFCCQKNQSSTNQDISMSHKTIANILEDLKGRSSPSNNNSSSWFEKSNSFISQLFKSNNSQPTVKNVSFKFDDPKQMNVMSPFASKTTFAMNQPETNNDLLEKRSLQEFKKNITSQSNKFQSNFGLKSFPVRTRSIDDLCSSSTPQSTPVTNSYNYVSNRNIQNDVEQPQLLAKISEESSNIKPTKERSIHTINEPVPVQPTFQDNNNPYLNYHQDYHQQQCVPYQPNLFPNTTWFLHENLSDQFGFNQALGTIQPVFEEGNLYAECYEYPTVPVDLFRTMVAENSPMVHKKKDFKILFLPYGRSNFWF